MIDKRIIDELSIELKEILEQLSGRITEEEMSAMNYDVRVNKRKARDVAIEYLKNNDLI